jgi:uncharacterized protein YbjT (DUF2867 family)
MKVAIAGGHGKIGLRLARLLSGRGDEVRSLIRNPDHRGDVSETGAEPAVCDLETASDEEVAEAIARVDAVVFAAGAGPGSGAQRKETMDYGGAVKLIAAARIAGVDRYAMVSSRGADPNAEGEGFAVYLRAKGRADAALQESALAYTIVRPVSLTDDAGTGRVEVGDSVAGQTVSRDDVAALFVAVLDAESTIGKTFEAAAGDVAIDEAIRSL